MRNQSAIRDCPKYFLARPSLQLHEIEVLGDMNVAVDKSIRRIGLVKLHQLRLLEVIKEKLHLALIENL